MFELMNQKNGFIGLSYRKGQSLSIFIILGVWFFSKSHQIGLILFGYYLILGKTIGVKPSPLSKEEQKLYSELTENKDD